MSDDLNKIRDELAREQGRRHAHPEIRSMYPMESRGVMAHQFAQLFSLGWDACAAEYERIKTTRYDERIAEQERRIAGLVEALKFYANWKSWDWAEDKGYCDTPLTNIKNDDGPLTYRENDGEEYTNNIGGKRAREALEKFGGRK